MVPTHDVRRRSARSNRMSEPSYRKQEQEPASEAVTEVAPGVLRLMLPIDMPGLGHVNCYALEDERGFALVDPGLPGDVSWRALMDRLATAGIPLGRVHTAVVTHSHVDHFGGSDQLREEAGAEILTHEAFESEFGFDATNDDIDMDLLDLDEEELVELWKRKWDQMGAPTTGAPGVSLRPITPFDARSPWAGQEGIGSAPPNPPCAWSTAIRSSSPVVNGSRCTRPATRPTTSAYGIPPKGSCCRATTCSPSITPHIAGTTALDDPLASFFASLTRVSELEGVTLTLPAHGHPFSDLTGRTNSIITHHEERLDVLRDAADELVDAPVEAYMKVLFKQRSWGNMAASETYAHLEHLEVAGEASRRHDADGLMRYTITRSAA